MRAPAFWWHPPGIASAALAPLGALYGAVAGARLARAGEVAPIPAICIGNFVAGGAGKTPAAIAVANRLRDLGRAPVFLSRGYGGRLRGPVRVDPLAHGWTDVGDEALLLAAVAPAIVSRDRRAGAALAPALGDVLVLDDGFQNPSLRKDLSIVVIDGEVGIGNGRVMPAGPLRAPLHAQAKQADAILAVGDGRGEALARALGLPLLRGTLQPDLPPDLAGQRVMAFCGIGRPQKFFDTVAALGAVIVEARAFADHHWYTDPQARALLARAAELDAVAVTTAKDAVRLKGSHSLRTLAFTARVVRVKLVFEDEGLLDGLLSQALDRRLGGP